ncbi:outer membrane beta-barrel family protein [Mesonia aquimarina]|uniref:outer membrane beta-barrel family protein n=1 Tax=Mesonia aquimarina TaxID=1504967 RepID=UPI000EF5E6DC|nr:outer membrane beta-barrel family protein [Mesonia aquimarina]
MLHAQHSISGKVLGKDKRVLEYVNLSLFSAENTDFIQGTISNKSGDFIFEDIPRGSYVLHVSFMGFTKEELQIDLLEDTILNPIVLSTNQSHLSEVQIEIKQPNIRKEDGKLIFNVENTSLSSGNTWSLLKQTPGVISVQNDLLVRNQQATIYINSQKVYLSTTERKQLLESYSAENIRSIEVIHNPSAKYDAEDGPILNIITSKVLLPTYKGSIYKNYSQGIYAKYQVGTSHYYRTKKFNFFINYSINPLKKFKTDTSYINYINLQDEVFSTWQTDFDKTTRSVSQNAHAILDYEINKSNTISLNSNILFSPNEDVFNEVETKIFNNQKQLDSTFSTRSNLDNDMLNSATNIKYVHFFDEEITKLSVDAHFTYYHQDKKQDVLTDYFLPSGMLINENSFNTEAYQKINIYALQADFQTKIGDVDFNTGAKISRIDSNSKLEFFDVNTTASSFQEVPLLDEFDYHEYITAFYAEGSRNWDKFGLTFGLRIEDTHREGHSTGTEQVTKRDYVELFPNLHIKYKLSKDHEFSFDYGRKIKRPRYKSLNPFRYFLNENNFQSGNPNLSAAISNNFNLNYTFKNAYIFDFYYRDNGNNATQLVFQDNEQLNLRSIYANVLESNSYGVEFLHRRSIKKWWYAQAILSVYYEDETF